MIGTYSMTTDTKNIADTIERAIYSVKEDMAKKLKGITDDIYEDLRAKFDEYFSYDNSQNYLESISHEVRNIMRDLLAGDIDQIKQLNIVSEYTFDKLHFIRLKIWETCSKDIENCIIKEQNKKIEEMRKEIKYLRQRNDY